METQKPRVNTLRLVHCVDEIRFVQKVGKYVTEVQFHDYEKQTFWLTAKQAVKLEECMKRTKHGYSGRDCQVYAVITDGKFWAWSGVHTVRKSDVPWLCEKFEVARPDWLIDWERKTTVPVEGSVEVPVALMDEA